MGRYYPFHGLQWKVNYRNHKKEHIEEIIAYGGIIGMNQNKIVAESGYHF